MKSVPAPCIKKTPIEPLTQEEMQRMLKACIYSRKIRPSNRRSFTMRLRYGHRDQAIILTLIDTGLRAMELCKLLRCISNPLGISGQVCQPPWSNL